MKFIHRLITRLARAFDNNQHLIAVGTGRRPDEITAVSKGMQLLLASRWKELAARGSPFPDLADVEFRAFSQTGEDGILLYLFSILGTTNRRAVEICAGSGIECNTTNLIVNHGWEGLLFDGNAASIARGREFFRQCRDTRSWPPVLVQAWLTAENVNDLVAKHGYEGDIDLLSLDVDGIDYWLWKALTVIRPRVVILEFQDIIGPDRALTVPYDPQFVSQRGKHGPDYAGASLMAFVKLGREKGYRLVGAQRYGFNAFFVRNDVGAELLPEVPTSACFTHPRTAMGMRERWPKVKDRPWVEV